MHRLVRQICWRIHAPRWAFAPLSGEGAARNRRSTEPAGHTGALPLYLAFEHGTAIQEYEQDLGWRPGTLCAYRVSGRFADLREDHALEELGFRGPDLRCPWKLLAFSRPMQEPPSWRLADALQASRVSGAIYPSQASSAGTNLVLWRWNARGGAKVEVLDPLRDLPRDQASWL